MAGQVAGWLQRADAAVAAVVGTGVLCLHWDAFRAEFGVAAPESLVSAAAALAIAGSPALWLAAPSRVAALLSAVAAVAAGVALVAAGWPATTLGEVAVAVLVAQMAVSAGTEAAIAAFATWSNRTRTER
ncbi:MAG TPA: hypothetical protein VFZ89_13485 [Solirubrobacteraceae bacterium]